MFNNGEIAFIDVGSDKIFVKVGMIAKDNVFNIKASSEIGYDGFMEGDWLNGDEVSKSVTYCLDKALYNTQNKLSAIYVGVPSDFARVQTCANKMAFGCNHKINNGDIVTIKNGLAPNNDGRFEVIGSGVIGYRLDGKYETLEPIGKICYNLEVSLSFNMCKKSFCDLFKTILSDYTRRVKFIPLSLAQSLMATDKNVRLKNSAVLVDIGYLTTDIAYIRGDGLVALNTLPVGGGHIAYDLSYGLEIDYNQACDLKKELDLNMNDGEIEIETNKGLANVEKSFVNMIAKARIEEIAELIGDIIAKYPIKYESFLKIYLTGRGIAHIKGVRSVIASAINRPCELIKAKYDERNNIYLSTASIIQYTCEKDKQSKPNLLSKLFN